MRARTRITYIHIYSSFLSYVGDSFSVIAIPLLMIWDEAISLASVGFALAISAVPRLLFVLIGGVVSDKYNPIRVLLAMRVAYFVVTLSLCIGVLLSENIVYLIYGYSFITGVLAAVIGPASKAIIPILSGEDELTKFNGLNQSLLRISQIVGPLIAGGIMAILGETKNTFAIMFALDAFTFLIALIATIYLNKVASKFIKIEKNKAAHKSSKVFLGYSYILRNAGSLNWLFGYIALSSCLFTAVFTPALPIYVKDLLGYGPATLGSYFSIYSIGLIVGSLLSSKLKIGSSFFGYFVLIGDLLVGLLLCLLFYSPNSSVHILTLTLLGLINGLHGVIIVTWIQKITPKPLLGRMMSLVILCSIGLTPLIQIAFGFSLERFQVDSIAMVSGLSLALVSAIGMISRSMRQLGKLQINWS